MSIYITAKQIRLGLSSALASNISGQARVIRRRNLDEKMKHHAIAHYEQEALELRAARRHFETFPDDKAFLAFDDDGRKK